jgi:hypothetical protein
VAYTFATKNKTMEPAIFLIIILIISGMFTYRRTSIARAKMRERAAQLEAENTFTERTTLYLPLKGTLNSTKQKQIDEKISEMAEQEWIYLRGSYAGLKTMKSWGGGIDLHFAKV